MNLFKMHCVAMVLTAIVAGCSGSSDEAPGIEAKDEVPFELHPQQVAMAEVKTGHIEYRMISGVVAATGELEVPPEGRASLSAPSGGFIVENTLLPGMQVTKGQRLARLTNPDYVTLQQEYLETWSELQYAEKDFFRQRTLEAQNATALKKLQQSESTYNVLKGRLAGLKARLEMTGVDITALEAGTLQPAIGIRAPISGHIASARFAQGAFVEAKETIFEIVNMDELHVELNVFEQDIAKVAKGQPIRIRAVGSETSYSGIVMLISPERNAQQRTFTVHGHIAGRGDELRAGMFVEADILVDADSLPALPEEALVYQDTKPFVLVGRGGSFVLQPVQTGGKMDGWVEIRDPGRLMTASIVIQGAARVFAAMKRREGTP